MRCNTERYKICLRCIEDIKGRTDFPTVIKYVEDRIQKKSKWKNPVCVEFDKASFNRVREIGKPSLKVCLGCPYKLEHTVLEQGVVDEIGRGLQ